MKNRIDRFLDAIEEIFSGMDVRTFWPLNAGQIDAYFDVAEALDMYDRLMTLRKTKSISEIAALLPHPDILRIFLQHNAIIGLKVANKLGLANIKADDRVKYLELIFDVLEKKVRNDIFCLDGKNIIWGPDKVDSILDGSGWVLPNNGADKNIAYLGVAASNLCYSLYLDVYMTAGFYLHGPYDVSDKYGPGHIMLVRQYHELSPKELWPDAELEINELQICSIYKNLDWKINFANHPLTMQSMPDKLLASRITLDGKRIASESISDLIDSIEELTRSQTAIINSLKPLEQVKKGAEIAYYLFQDLRLAMGDDWHPSPQVNKNIEEFGDRFIKQFAVTEKPEIKHWRKLFDPRIDEY